MIFNVYTLTAFFSFNSLRTLLKRPVFFAGLLLVDTMVYADGDNSCSRLAGLNLPHTVITQAEAMAAGDFLAPDGNNYTVPAFCKVHGVAVPTKDSHINFEVWLPSDTWNGRFYQLGTGGMSGSLDAFTGKLVEGIERGNVVAMTDGGHQSSILTEKGFQAINPDWALHQPEKIIDFGYRALKETTDSAKSLIKAYYGRQQAYSYYVGCSGGGREAMVAAHRFSKDWDGILVGAPANHFVRTAMNFAWADRAVFGDKASQIPVSKLPAIQKAALASCTEQAHVVNGIATDARFCRPDTQTMVCEGEENDKCLTRAQAAALHKLYDGVRSPSTGELIYPGFTPSMEAETGDTGGWNVRFMADRREKGIERGPEAFINRFFRMMVVDDMAWDSASLDFDRDIELAMKKTVNGERLVDILGPVSPDFSTLQEQGAKVIMYHGWGDAALTAVGGIADYETVVRKTGSLRETQSFYRLYMVPGMLHCSTGPGAHSFGQVHTANRLPALKQDAAHDIAMALEEWVEKDIVPEKVIATKYINDDPGKGVAFTRPLCPYPQLAIYDGVGDINEAASFSCQKGTLPKEELEQ